MTNLRHQPSALVELSIGKSNVKQKAAATNVGLK